MANDIHPNHTVTAPQSPSYPRWLIAWPRARSRDIGVPLIGAGQVHWVLGRRLDDANKLLETTSWSVTGIAEACRFRRRP